MQAPILIIGGGAIGSLVAAQLAQAGETVTLVGRPRSTAAIRRDGLRLSEEGRTTTLRQVQAAASLAEAFTSQPEHRLAILTVKSYDTAAALAELQEATASPPPLLTLQNGLGNEELLAAALGPERVIAGVITTPATVPEPGLVMVERPLKRVGLANLAVEPALPAAQVAGLLGRAGFQVQVYDHWASLKWTKLVMNMLCNASCALLGWSPAQVWADPRLAGLEIAAWREALAVLRRQGSRLVNLGGYPLGTLEPLLRWLPEPLLRPILGRFVIAGRGGKMPSLYLDLAKGKGRSEVAWLNGAVVRTGEAVGLAAPVNRALNEALAAVLSGREPWTHYRDRPESLLERL